MIWLGTFESNHMNAIICEVSLLCRALYAKCPYYAGPYIMLRIQKIVAIALISILK